MKAELHNAFIWTCPCCEMDNFARGVICEFSEEDREEITEAIGETPVTGEWISAPVEVKCQYCASEFETN